MDWEYDLKKVYLIRHGATAGNLMHRYVGRTDEPLCEEGERQAKACRNLPEGDVLLVSPMLRCRQTAEIMFPGKPQTVVEDFRETDFGIFEGKTARELEGNKAYSAWLDTFCQGPIPGGDSVADFKTRCVAAFLSTVNAGNNPVFVVHGGVIMSILEALALPRKGFYDYHVKNCRVISCLFDGEHLFIQEEGSC